jgi:alpha-L-rhamnosidase
MLAGVAGPDERQAVIELLTSTRRASPYMERFVLEALFELGETDRALHRMRKHYAHTAASTYSTLYEVWEYHNPAVTSSTYNHAWSGCPAHLLPQYLANLRPLESGWRRFSVRLQIPPGPLSARVTGHYILEAF